MNRKKLRKIYFIIPALLVLGFLFYFSPLTVKSISWLEKKDALLPRQMAVYFIDVEQGDSILIITPNRKNILIDGGPIFCGKKVVTYLRQQGVKQIDLVIATHPHEDHIGGLLKVLKDIPVKKILNNSYLHKTDFFYQYLKIIDRKDIPFEEARPGQKINLDKEITIEILGPVRDNYDNLNNSSIVTKITYGKVKFLFPGDIEKEAEEDLLDKDISAEILKVAHHGSRTSTTEPFLKKIKPETGVISLGKDNPYGHPHKQVVKRLEKYGVKVLRTDELGDIIIITDGKSYQILKKQGGYNESRYR